MTFSSQLASLKYKKANIKDGILLPLVLQANSGCLAQGYRFSFNICIFVVMCELLPKWQHIQHMFSSLPFSIFNADKQECEKSGVLTHFKIYGDFMLWLFYTARTGRKRAPKSFWKCKPAYELMDDIINLSSEPIYRKMIKNCSTSILLGAYSKLIQEGP